ncbi:hypothetical protein Tco_1429858 [Tanacetum coccineum]
MSPSTGVSSSTEASGSKPRSNTKKDKISQTSCSNEKTNKVESHEISEEGKTVAETEEGETGNSEHEEDDTKGQGQKSNEEPKRDDQAKEAEVGVPDLMKIKEKSEFLQSTSSHSISLNFGNQVLINSPNASIIGTIPKNTDKEITSMMEIEIQQDVPLVQNEPFHEVKVSVIPETTQQPPSTPPAPPRLATGDPAALIPSAIGNQRLSWTGLPDAFQKVIQSHTKGFKKEVSMKKEEYKDYIQETVANEVKNQLSMVLPKAISDFANLVIQSTIKETLEQTPVISAQSSAQPQSSYAIAESLTEFKLKKILMEKMKRSKSYQTADQHKILYDGLVNSYLLDKDLFESYGQTVS